jgi:hypothetical protein
VSIHALADTLVACIVEHLDRPEYGAITMTRKQHFSILVFAGLPLFLGLGLLALNPRYMGRMFIPGYANVQPQGMIMTAAIIFMAVAAYMTQRWSLTLSGKLAGKGRTVIPGIFYVSSFILFILPAVLLVLFGPAALLLMEAGIIG